MTESDSPRSGDTTPPEIPPASARAGDEGLPEEFILTPEIVEEEAIRGDIVMRGAVVLLATLLGWTHITGTATLVRIRTGQELAAHGILPPRTDSFFSYTATDRPWANLSWLGDLLLAGVHAIGGDALLSAVCGLVCGVTFWVIGRTSLPGLPTWWGSICAGLAVLAVFPLLTPGPTLMTVAGLAVTLYLLHGGQVSSGGRAWWLLTPTLLVWSNTDPRAYLGMVLLALYAVGCLLAPADERTRRPLIPLLVAIVAGLVHPFPLEVVRSPITLVRQFHPLWLEYGGENAAEYPYLWRPVFAAETTAAPGWHLTAAIVLALLMVITLILNRRRLDWGELLSVLGLNLLALTSGIDFSALAVVNAVVAARNGQRWYAANCRQQYTLDRWELFCSRAGRAVTVFALFAAAYWGLSGWMTGAAGRRVGFGFSNALQAQVEGYQSLLGEVGRDQFDDHPFHLTPSQGDLLIWLGRKSFTDSRLLLFAGDGEANLLQRQREIAASLRSPDEPLTTPEAIAAWARKWKEPFATYDITHVVIPLQTPDGYRLWVNLASQGMATDAGDVVRFWQPAGMTGPATVLYSLEATPDGGSGELDAFLREHGQSTIVRETFRVDEDAERPARGVYPRGPTFYETSLLLPEPVVPNDSLTARHYATRLGAAQRSLFETIAYCHQIIRHGRRGLVVNPNSAESYLLLGEAYQRLWEAESATASNRLAADAVERRFLQAVFAYHHAAIARPDSPQPHAALYPLYLQHGDYDLALKHLDRVNALSGYYTLVPRDDPAFSQNQQQLKRLRGELEEQLQRGREAVEKAQLGGLETTVRTAMQAQCPGYALELLSEDLTLTIGSVELSQQYARLLLLAGRTQEGLEQAERQLASLEGTPLELTAGQSLRPVASLANLAADQYERSLDLWDRYGQMRLKTVLDTHMTTLPGVTLPGEQGDGWPIFQIISAAEAITRWLPDWELSRWQMAMTELESGHNTEAARLLEQVLEADPQSLLRPMIAMYLTMLTGQSVEPFLPGEPETGASTGATHPDRPPSPALPMRAEPGE